MEPNLIINFFFLAIGAGLGFFAGSNSREYPSEEVMFDRLVSLRSTQKIEASTKEATEREIEVAATNRASQSHG